MSDCLFCNIAARTVPAVVVSESDRFLAFRDINPQAPTHVLCIPKSHVASLEDATESDTVGALVSFARDVARREGLAERGYRVVINTHDDGGQTVAHLHVHLLGGRRMTWPPG